MSPPTQQNGGAAHPAAPSSGRQQAAEHPERTAPDRHQLVRAKAFAAAPAGRRALWVMVVPRCPHCGICISIEREARTPAVASDLVVASTAS